MGATHRQASEELVEELEELEELKDAADELYDELKFQESHDVRQRHLALTRRVYGEGVLRPDLNSTQGPRLYEIEFGVASRGNTDGALAYQ